MTINEILLRFIDPLTVLANLVFIGLPLAALMILDRLKGRWAGWRYYGLAFSVLMAMYFLAIVLIYGECGLRWKTFGTLGSVALIAFFIAYMRATKGRMKWR